MFIFFLTQTFKRWSIINLFKSLKFERSLLKLVKNLLKIKIFIIWREPLQTNNFYIKLPKTRITQLKFWKHLQNVPQLIFRSHRRRIWKHLPNEPLNIRWKPKFINRPNFRKLKTISDRLENLRKSEPS